MISSTEILSCLQEIGFFILFLVFIIWSAGFLIFVGLWAYAIFRYCLYGLEDPMSEAESQSILARRSRERQEGVDDVEAGERVKYEYESVADREIPSSYGTWL